jgi:hypothetical protein
MIIAPASFDELTAGKAPRQGRWCFGKTPMQTFLDALTITREKMIAA